MRGEGYKPVGGAQTWDGVSRSQPIYPPVLSLSKDRPSYTVRYMHFWAYMLHCRGGVFYVGHTDDLDRRIAEHQHGEIAGYTRRYLPVALVWSQAFQTREDARAAEKQIKGWSRAKKLALIGGDWREISRLAKERSKKSDPSTSSGRTGEWPETAPGLQADRSSATLQAPRAARPELVEKPALSLSKGLFLLIPHLDTAPLAVTAIRARITAITEHWLTIRWSVAGASKIVLPAPTGKRRADDLWRHTCFETFLQSPGNDAYVELNLSPSESWAAYDFARYREGMRERVMPRQPNCTARVGGNTVIFDAAVPMAGLPPRPWRVGLSAVIEEEGGIMSYWALAHPPGPPDFHHPACLALAVPAPPPA